MMSAPLNNDDIVIVRAKRLPIGAFRGSYSKYGTVQLASRVVNESVHSLRGIVGRGEPNPFRALYAGIALPFGLGQAPDKQILTVSGLPNEVVTTYANKVCASGMKILSMAANDLKVGQYSDMGDGGYMICVGADNMSKVPSSYGDECKLKPLLFDALIDASESTHMGIIVASMCDRLGITREMQDEFAISSYERAISGWETGKFQNEVCFMDETQALNKDEDLIRFNKEKMKTLTPVFGTTITAANASSLADGAACLVLCSRSYAEKKNVEPLAKIVAYADAGIAPKDFGMAPTDAIKRLLRRAVNDRVQDFGDVNDLKNRIEKWEINEAFSGVVLANIQKLGLDPAIVNVDGGAVAMGHPLGMSGARIVVHMVHTLSGPGALGVCAVCNGGGGASAIMLEKM